MKSNNIQLLVFEEPNIKIYWCAIIYNYWELILLKLNRVIVIINFVSRFQSFTGDTVGWWENNYNVSLMNFLRQSIAEPEFYGELVYRFRKIVDKSSSFFSEQYRKLIKRIGYNLDIMRQPACLAVNPITVDNYVFLFNCTTAVRASDSMTAFSENLGPDAMSLAWPAVVQLMVFFNCNWQCLQE